MMEDDSIDCVVVSPVIPTPALENMTFIDEKGEYGDAGKTIEDITHKGSPS
jgi:hypothetical protein